MADEFLGERKKALEESFFARENAKLVEQMKADKEKRAHVEGLSAISGISDAPLLDKLAELGIESGTWAAVSLVPLVEVAWASGRVEPKERTAVMSAAEANGIVSGSPSHTLLESWLARRPDGRLLEAWGEYIVVLCQRLSETERHAVRENVLGRARAVAEAAGGFLGLGSKVSAEEEVVLSELEKAFA